MEKEELIDKLEEIKERLEEIQGKVEEIPDTAVNEIDALINGDRKKSYYYGQHKEIEIQGLDDYVSDTYSKIDDLIDKLKED